MRQANILHILFSLKFLRPISIVLEPTMLLMRSFLFRINKKLRIFDRINLFTFYHANVHVNRLFLPKCINLSLHLVALATKLSLTFRLKYKNAVEHSTSFFISRLNNSTARSSQYLN